MINVFVLEGRLVNISDLRETEKGIKFASLTLDVTRSYRNADGNFETDQFNIDIWRGVAEICSTQCKPGDFISLQGRVQTSKLTNNDGKEFIVYNFIAEKVSFIPKKQ